jgi:methylenetetrahydrofolate reductase (NADPH)
MNAIRPILPETNVHANRPRVSFEFFPPRTEALENQLWDSIRKLEPLAPSFVSVTYGAGGSTRDRTHRIVSRIVRETSLKPAAHLTTVSASRSEVDAVLRDYRNAGVRHIVALRGDPPGGVGLPYLQHPQGYASAIELTEAAARIGGFEISVAVHPEKHPASPTWEHEIDNFKRKLAAGATRGISQFFFDADVFLRFRDKLARAGVYAPVLPGIMPVTNVKGLKKMADACGASLPRWLIHLPGRRSGNAPPGDGGDDGATLRASGGGGRAGLSFLHVEPRRSGVGDLPDFGFAGGGGQSVKGQYGPRRLSPSPRGEGAGGGAKLRLARRCASMARGRPRSHGAIATDMRLRLFDSMHGGWKPAVQ